MQRPLSFGSRFCLLAALFAAPAINLHFQPRAVAQENPFPGKFAAPDLEGGVEWFNTSREIDIRELKGKVVLLDFWTYCCINCMHILPDLKYLEHKYKNELVVIGVHSAKFDNEKDSENIRNAILRYDIEHPVVNDANSVIARKYHFMAWPQLVLVDPEGKFIGLQTGEGNRELFDNVIAKMIEYHRAKGTLDENPVSFDLERNHAPPGPLKYPGKLLADPAGKRLFISDSGHNRIVVAGLDGQLISVIGSGAFGAQNGSYTAASFAHPQGMALVDRTLYVADTENHLIRTVDLDTETVATLAGTGHQAQQPSLGGPLQTTPLNSPWDLLHHNGALFIAMAGPHQLWRHELGTPTIEAFAGSSREDIIDGPRDTCALAQPSGLTTDGKELYFVDSEGSAVRHVPLSGNGNVKTIVGAHDMERGRSLFEFGDIDGAAAKARLQHPIGLTWHDGLLYVADTYNHKIKKVHPTRRTSETWLGTGKPGTSLSPIELFEPSGLVPVGNTLYIADCYNHRIVTVDFNSPQSGQEFIVAGLAPPTPPETPQAPAENVVADAVPAQRVKPGDALQVRIGFELPEGFKLNPEGPVKFTLTPVGNASLVAIDKSPLRGDATKGENEATFTLPLSAKSGTGTYDLTLTYTFCHEGKGGVCRFAKQAWRVPVEVAADAEADSVTLTASPK
ncbi:MAG: thioredoxin-like domain-containing protein [Planctomycetaceae bacterium]